MSQRPSIFSFFSGTGFLDLGFELSGYNIVYVNEIHPPFLEAYRYSREQLNLLEPEYNYFKEDVIKLTEGKDKLRLKELIQDARKSSNIIGFIGGPPCPDFSIGGKNKGGEGERGKLSAAYIELICQQKPDFFLFENVKGLWQTKKHRLFFDELKSKTQEAGYVLTERLINSLEYGVPQDRDRIILLGFREELIIDKSNHIDLQKNIVESAFPWKKYIKYSKREVLSYPWLQTNQFQEDSELPFPGGIPQELTVEYWFKQNDVLNHLNAQHHFKPRAGLNRFKSVEEGDTSKKSYKRLHRWRYSPTACYGNNEVHLHPYKTRRISVAEALAIQSLPKNFYLPPYLPLNILFKTVGNGVPYLAAQALAQTILDYLEISKVERVVELIS
ncbi:DNA cytosine methyltransferase [Microcoleus sp. FACHB-672]|uniref:DNA cytosine methyltransferase n=1 Tax=Microcoleus sp. FACHB-672 TaxID=2692825 RepID=UPI00168822B0|nr:DNA cytosine methyltransferase [Microcoleus sp. FACHB-672]MBD2040510.1 DNA cytosine methyltransferase [Microcoleus sp. FACHB-672]